MDARTFFVALVAEARIQGMRDFAYDPEAIRQGLEAAIREAKLAGLEMGFSDKPAEFLSRVFVATCCSNRLLRPIKGRLRILLVTPHEAEYCINNLMLDGLDSRNLPLVSRASREFIGVLGTKELLENLALSRERAF